MKQTQGKCKYCGQYIVLEVPDTFTEEDINEEASRKCSCPQAEARARIEENIASAEGAIKALFNEKENVTYMRDVLIGLARPIAEGKLGSVIITRGNYSAAMRPSKDGIKILLKHTEQESIES